MIKKDNYQVVCFMPDTINLRTADMHLNSQFLTNALRTTDNIFYWNFCHLVIGSLTPAFYLDHVWYVLYLTPGLSVTSTGTMVTDGFPFRISLVSGYKPCGCSLVKYAEGIV